MNDRSGQVWELDLTESGFDPSQRDVIVFVVLRSIVGGERQRWLGWHTYVLYDEIDDIEYRVRPETVPDDWERQPEKYRRVA